MAGSPFTREEDGRDREWRHPSRGRGARANGRAILAIAAAGSLVATSSALSAPSRAPQPHRSGVQTARAAATPARARGIVFTGLRRSSSGACRNEYRLSVPTRVPMCSHGPDPAPAGVDVTTARTLALLASSSATSATVPCIGDGVSGARVQVVYAVASDLPDRYTTVAPQIQGWAATMDSEVAQSAAQTGGERHIRFVTNPDCSLDVAHVVLPPTGDDSLSNTITALQSLGYNLSSRKYMIWADANVYCGIAQVSTDDTAGSTNASNTTAGYARIDSACWGMDELHELMHTLGAVELSAPHSTGHYHCTDGYDTMCYQDSSGVTMTYPCPSSQQSLLDCGHDDYFSTAPVAGSYLATHWNTADSAFLAGSVSGATGTPALSLTRSASPTSYSAVGQTITYGYTIANAGTTTLGPAQFTVSDSRINAGASFACGPGSTTLAPGAAVSCSATSAITQTDLDAGSVASSATAAGGGVTTPAVAVTVNAAQTRALSLARTASPTTYSAAGQTIALGYTVENAGNVTLGPAQFTVSDTAINAGAPFACGSSSTTLAPGATVVCSSSYTTTQADVTAGSVSSSATATGGGATSTAASMTVTAVVAPSTTTTTFTGSVSSKRPSASFALTVGSGPTASALTFTATGKTKTTPTLSLRVLNASGTVVASTSGPSVLKLTTPSLAAGTYKWQVSGSISASFSLQVTYTTP